MQRQTPSLKRSAPGTSPVQPQNMSPPNPTQAGYTQPDGNFGWTQGSYGGLPVSAMDPSTQDPSAYGMGAGIPGAGGYVSSNSQELVRRNVNQQLAAPSNYVLQNGMPSDEDEDQRLTMKAQEARREAEANKKGIPPFVQKLSSFLDDPNNHDLIRWSDDGLHFLILDEEAFAKDVIPHFWKHSNYASFVRQLNMYGFKKDVGLADNSLKASESKTKQPSRYYHHNFYFRRGRPDLLWLIQKPSKPTPANRKGDSKQDEEGPNAHHTASAVNHAAHASDRTVEVSEEAMNQIKKEVSDLRKQNQLITNVINALRKQDINISQQAFQFAQEQQRMQNRHDQQVNSLNAVITFLFSIFNNRLDAESRIPFDNMLKAIMPGSSSNVVEVQDIPDLSNMNFSFGAANTPQPRRRQLLLLPPDSLSAQATAQTPQYQPMHGSSVVELPNTPLPKTEPPTPQTLGEDIMTYLNTENIAPTPPMANSSLNYNGSSASASHRGSLSQPTTQQTPASPNSASRPPTAAATPAPPLNQTQALSPRTPQQTFSPLPAVPSLTSQHSYDLLKKLQEEQNTKIQSLASRLGPLSPNGHIPGLHDASNVPAPDPEFDFDSWLNDDAAFGLGSGGTPGAVGHGLDSNDLFGPPGDGGLDFDAPDTTAGTAFTDFGTPGFLGDGGVATNTTNTTTASNGALGRHGNGGHVRVHSVSSAGAGSPGATTASPASPVTVETVGEGETPGAELFLRERQPAKRRRRNG